MNKIAVFLFVALTLGACDKVKKTEKTLTGVWTLYQYKHTNSLGLEYFYPVSGTMDFGSCGDAICHYSLRADYTVNSQAQTKYEDGSINISDTDKFTMDRFETNGSITHLDEGRFLLMTKDDIKLAFSDETGVHEFILER